MVKAQQGTCSTYNHD